MLFCSTVTAWAMGNGLWGPPASDDPGHNRWHTAAQQHEQQQQQWIDHTFTHFYRRRRRRRRRGLCVYARATPANARHAEETHYPRMLCIILCLASDLFLSVSPSSTFASSHTHPHILVLRSRISLSARQAASPFITTPPPEYTARSRSSAQPPRFPAKRRPLSLFVRSTLPPPPHSPASLIFIAYVSCPPPVIATRHGVRTAFTPTLSPYGSPAPRATRNP